MEFEPATVEHLGLKLYVSMPPVIGELVSNSWDADAEVVQITIPTNSIGADSEILFRDNGSGMDAGALQNAYLKIGRNCREDLGSDKSARKKRKLMGRKGLGKLAAFGVADEVEVRTVRAGDAICIRLNYLKMRSTPPGKKYEPELVPEKCGNTTDSDGTEIRIRCLRRTNAIAVEWIRRELARRFTVIERDFKVLVNEVAISPKDRRLRDDCRKAWNVSELPGAGVIDVAAGWNVTGWIGLVTTSSQIDRGIDVFASGKAAELETMFGVKSTHVQFARAYVVGEIHADFLDAGDDQIATGRNAIQWESDEGQKLATWGQAALKHVFNRWLELQRQAKEEQVVKTAGFDIWLKARSKREQKVAMKLVKAIVDDPNVDPEAARPVLEAIKSNVEFQAFQELVDEIDESGASVTTMLRLFDDWRLIEAREQLKLSDGRLEIIEKLSKFVKEGALEVQQIQPLFEDNAWLVNPSWGSVTGQTRYTKLLRENCREPKSLDEKDRRMDILGYSVGGALEVVELKRPEKTLTREDLEQVERYVDWARANLQGSGADSPTHVRGLLIVGKMSRDASLRDKMVRLAGSDIRVETFDDLLHKAETLNGEVERRLKDTAPEYSRSARKGRRRK